MACWQAIFLVHLCLESAFLVYSYGSLVIETGGRLLRARGKGEGTGVGGQGSGCECGWRTDHELELVPYCSEMRTECQSVASEVIGDFAAMMFSVCRNTDELFYQMESPGRVATTIHTVR